MVRNLRMERLILNFSHLTAINQKKEGPTKQYSASRRRMVSVEEFDIKGSADATYLTASQPGPLAG